MPTTIDVLEALAPLDQQFISALQAIGWNDTELRSLAKAWNVAENDINAIIGPNPNTKDPLETETKIAIIAAGINHAITTRARPSTPAIVNATPEDLLAYIDYYYAELTRLYAELVAAQFAAPGGRGWEDPTWCSLKAQFDRLAGFLWEAENVAGIHNLQLATAA